MKVVMRPFQGIFPSSSGLVDEDFLIISDCFGSLQIRALSSCKFVRINDTSGETQELNVHSLGCMHFTSGGTTKGWRQRSRSMIWLDRVSLTLILKPLVVPRWCSRVIRDWIRLKSAMVNFTSCLMYWSVPSSLFRHPPRPDFLAALPAATPATPTSSEVDDELGRYLATLKRDELFCWWLSYFGEGLSQKIGWLLERLRSDVYIFTFALAFPLKSLPSTYFVTSSANQYQSTQWSSKHTAHE